MERILGLDLGTNSLGWAIVEKDEAGYTLIDKGVDIFQEGVAREKNIEKPAVQDRTNARASRRHYFRRRLRKIELLKVLMEYNLCPQLRDEDMYNWKQKKAYPLNDEFIQWQRTDDNIDKNPYHYRFVALTEKLDLSKQCNSYILGRALYHLGQRRGFLSNRKDNSNSDEDGKVKGCIKSLSEEISFAGCGYLGEYYYQLYKNKQKIRNNYTSRNEHYLAEFRAICSRQELPDELCKKLERAIFFQRPLKSQKGLVGKCTFEKSKSRCPSSHPAFEEFRMLSFINNIKVQTLLDGEPRSLAQDEIDLIIPLFMRKSKPHFDFEEIAKKIAGKGNYSCKGDNSHASYRFNFSATTNVAGCPVMASLKEIFGNDWINTICSVYTLAEGKTELQIINDVWHVLFSFDSDELLYKWAQEKLQLSEEDAKKFVDIKMPQDYAALSLNAINKILPYLRLGYRYDEAVFVANLKSVLPDSVYTNEAALHEVEQNIVILIEDYKRNPLNKKLTKEQVVSEFLRNHLGLTNKNLSKLYHPSMIETYQKAQPNEYGVLQLGSPRTASVRNPMAMRSLFRLRHLINALLREGKIDKNTKINIEFARGLNDANKRKAIEQYQREREAEHIKYAEEIRKQYVAETGMQIELSGEDILKYRLWEEQKHICIYTGKNIRISDFLGSSPLYDIEHTIPRSRGGDNSQMNKTLCENYFNRYIKKDKIPSELSNHAEVLARIETLGWKEKIESFEKQIAGKIRRSKNASTKQEKDNAIQQRHNLQMQLNDCRGKYERFTMTDVPQGFANRQGVDIGIIGRYARLYLQTVFEKIYTVKGATTAEFRKMWGLQSEYEKKARVNHVHHCIDAITIACIGRKEYDLWAQYVGDEEIYRRGEGVRPVFVKPWPTFTEDVKSLADSLLVSHHTADNMPKRSRKKLRIRGKVQLNKDGNPIYMQGDSARAVLHMQTFYGAIKRDDEIKYVVRKSLDQLQQSDIDKIVDDVVREKVKEAVTAVGFKKAISSEHTIWMNEEKGVPIRKVRIFTPGVTNPIHLKKQRDKSDKEHKQDYHVANDSNYCMAIYEGTNGRRKTVRSFRVVSNLEAAKSFKDSAKKIGKQELVPLSDSNDYPLKWILKTGTMVLFYENSPDEFKECTPEELSKRLYKLVGMSLMLLKRPNGKIDRYGVLSFKYHQEARPSGELKSKNAAWKVGEEYRPVIGMYHTQLNAYVEGYDFELTITGEIKFKH